MIAAVGYIVGYDGEFKFENIGDDYITNHVPYVAYRTLGATLGALTVPVLFNILKESGFSVWSCVLGASLVLFDNAHIAEDRLILLDATLIFSVACSLYCYVKFSKLRASPYSRAWWKWLLLTGVSLSCVISTKYVGTFTFSTIGLAVLIDLWNLLDIKRGLSMKQFGKQFAARAFALIILPFMIFLYWFWVHFTVLSRSGTGDAFHSPAFQQTLGDNPLAKESRDVYYNDLITIKHKVTGALLHSHEARYPLRYEDGRISSQGQQVTGYSYPDDNNWWQILPKENVEIPEGEIRKVGKRDTIRLRHVATNTMLYTHDVASPWYPTNEEFTTLPMEEALGDKYSGTLFNLNPVLSNSDVLQTKSSYFKLVHVDTVVGMFCQATKKLPDWGFNQFEVNGAKNLKDPGVTWTVDEIHGVEGNDRISFTEKVTKSMPFIKKYLELQQIMFAQNNALTVDHPYASRPITWPFLIRGVSFWTKEENRTQIYFIGNMFGWWFCIGAISIYIGVVIADQLSRRRGIYAIGNRARSKLYNSMGFFFVAWSTHYFPFFLMARQLFLHHYLPAHMASALLAAGIFDFIMGELDDDHPTKKSVWSNKKLVISTIALVALIFASFIYFAPLTYGWPSLTPEQVRARQLFSIELHFAK